MNRNGHYSVLNTHTPNFQPIVLEERSDFISRAYLMCVISAGCIGLKKQLDTGDTPAGSGSAAPPPANRVLQPLCVHVTFCTKAH